MAAPVSPNYSVIQLYQQQQQQQQHHQAPQIKAEPPDEEQQHGQKQQHRQVLPHPQPMEPNDDSVDVIDINR